MASLDDILDWLGTDSRGVPYYLHPLNLVWSPQGAEDDLLRFQEVAARLQGDRGLWAGAIRCGAWRNTLAACVCLLVAKERSFFHDLCGTFTAGTWVIPQVAVTIALLHPEEGRLFFEEFLASPKAHGSAKRMVSAQRVLERMGIFPESEIRLSGWPVLEDDIALEANRIVLEQWEFWFPRLRSLHE